jgi:hypothetical protein
MVKHVHDYHRDEHSLHAVGLMFVVLLDEWLRMQLGLSAQLVECIFMLLIGFSPLCNIRVSQVHFS